MTTDDPKIITLPNRRIATVTGEVPSECPDRFKRSDDLRNVTSLPVDLTDDDTMERCGLGRAIPHGAGARLSMRVLAELRDRALSAATADAEAERALLIIATQLERAANMVTLSRVENETLARRLSELLGENPPKGAA